MKSWHCRAFTALLAVSIVPPAAPAVAQTAYDDSVARRPREDFKPFGIELDALLAEIGLLSRETVADKSSPASSFLVFPKFAVTTRYDSNIYRADGNAKPDQMVIFTPELVVVSDWTSHRLELKLQSDIARYDNFPTENYNDARAEVNGRVDATDRLHVNGSVIAAQRHEKRGDPDDPGASVAPVMFHEGTVKLGTEYAGDPVLLRGGLESTVLDFHDSGGFDADERDRVEHRATLRAGYEFVPGTTVFVETKGNLRRFRQTYDNLGFEQDSQGYEVLLGGTWDVSGVTFVEFGIGYLTQSYDDPAFATIRSTSFSGKLVWNPTDLLTVTARLERGVKETQEVGVAGILTSRFSAMVDYEFFESTILSLGFAYTNGDYRGSDRLDHGYNAKLGAKYLINRNFFSELTVEYDRRDSNLEGLDFKSTQISARVGAQF